MKSSGRRIGLFSASAAMAVLALGIVGVAPAMATGHAIPATIGAPGIYNYNDGGIITEGGAATTLTINANGTFSLQYAAITDTGAWLQSGKTVALTVTSGEDGSAGCLLLGSVLHKGINSAAKPGPIDCEAEFAKTGTWYASVPKHVR